MLQSVFSPAPRRGVFTVLQRDDRRFDIQVFITCKIEWQTTMQSDHTLGIVLKDPHQSHFRYLAKGSATS